MSKKSYGLIFIIGAVIFLAGATTVTSLIVFQSAKGKIVFNKASSSVDSRIFSTNGIGFPTISLSAQDNWDVSPVLSPDGTKIAFECQNPDASLCIMNADGSNRIQVPWAGNRVFDINWSPDSNKIAFAGQSIYTVNFDGSHLTQLINAADGIDMWEPAWSPDGQKIAYTATARNSGGAAIN